MIKAITTLVLLFSIISCNGQTKIGNLTIPDSIAQKYFMDCYSHPDTVTLKTIWDNRTKFSFGGMTYYSSYSLDEEAKERVRVDSYNETIKALAIKQIVDTIYLAAYKDTVFNKQMGGILAESGRTDNEIKAINAKYRQVEKKSGIKEIKDVPAETYIQPTNTYLVPRKPSEQDFIRWNYLRQQQ